MLLHIILFHILHTNLCWYESCESLQIDSQFAPTYPAKNIKKEHLKKTSKKNILKKHKKEHKEEH